MTNRERAFRLLAVVEQLELTAHEIEHVAGERDTELGNEAFEHAYDLLCEGALFLRTQHGLS